MDYIYTVPNPPVSTVHEVMLLSNALLLCAICYSFGREQPLLQYSPDFHLGLTMPSEDTEDADTSSKSFVKDLDNIQRMDFLLHVEGGLGIEEETCAQKSGVRKVSSLEPARENARGDSAVAQVCEQISDRSRQQEEGAE